MDHCTLPGDGFFYKHLCPTGRFLKSWPVFPPVLWLRYAGGGRPGCGTFVVCGWDGEGAFGLENGRMTLARSFGIQISIKYPMQTFQIVRFENPTHKKMNRLDLPPPNPSTVAIPHPFPSLATWPLEPPPLTSPPHPSAPHPKTNNGFKLSNVAE